MSSKLDRLLSWVWRNHTQGPDLLNGHDSRLQAQHALDAGVKQAQGSIEKAYGEAKSTMNPYQQAGNEDFNNYRNAVYSGYFDTPYGGTYEPLSYSPQGYNPGSFDPKTQSFSGSQQRQPWTPGSRAATLSQPGLPSMGSQQFSQFGSQPPAQGAQQPGAGPSKDLVSMIKNILGGQGTGASGSGNMPPANQGPMTSGAPVSLVNTGMNPGAQIQWQNPDYMRMFGGGDPRNLGRGTGAGSLGRTGPYG